MLKRKLGNSNPIRESPTDSDELSSTATRRLSVGISRRATLSTTHPSPMVPGRFQQ
jgi:hypothetical protein